jgi:hypothetical protein
MNERIVRAIMAVVLFAMVNVTLWTMSYALETYPPYNWKDEPTIFSGFMLATIFGALSLRCVFHALEKSANDD